MAEVQVRSVWKAFDGTPALRGADLVVGKGRIVGLVGTNGSGKSTLIRVLAGYLAPDAHGLVAMNGKECELPLPPAVRAVIGVVHQDLGLVGSLSVVENLRLYRLASERLARIHWGRESALAERWLGEFGLRLSPRTQVSDLPLGMQIQIAVVRAWHQVTEACGTDWSQGLLVLDEATSGLAAAQQERVHALARVLRERGGSVLLVSHSLAEVMALCDDIVVLRDGATVMTVKRDQVSKDEVIGAMTGGVAQAQQIVSAVSVGDSGEALTVTHLSGGRIVEATFQAAKGEVLGAVGLAGSGAEDLPYVLCGAIPAREGTLAIGRTEYEMRRIRPHTALRMGVALLPGDRGSNGVIGSMSALENMAMCVFPQYWRTMRLRWRDLAVDAEDLMVNVHVVPPDPHRQAASFSGGNQQKLLMARLLWTQPRCLVLHGPSRGVDVQSRESIVRFLRVVCDHIPVVCVSDDYEELEEVCDRIIVFGNGRIVRVLAGSEVEKTAIGSAVLGSEGPVTAVES